MMYAAQYHYQTKGGMMITASHNPNGWLGFKLALGFSYTLGPDEMAELKELTESEDFAQGQGTLETIENYVAQYAEDVLSKIHIPYKVKALVNAGNGTAGPIAPDILRRANCEIVEFLTEPDLSFKHYFPNPSREDMMSDTGRETVSSGAQIGLAFDGDGDRLGVTDEKGNVVWPDQYMILLSREILKELPGSSIIFDTKSTRALSEDVKKHGGKPVMWKTGHSYIKEKLHELEAPLAGEMSGHVFFGKPYYYGFDDAVFSALKLVEMLSRSDKTFSQMIAETPHYVSSPTLNARCPDEIKYDVVAEIVQAFQNEGYEVVTFDNNPRLGGRIEFPDGWALVRASSNLPILVLRFEATTEERLEELKNMVRQKFSAYPPEKIGRDWESG
jgi:phosphomannomutase/phosphoglucomutase